MTDELEDQIIAKTQSYLNAKKNKEAAESAEALARVDASDAIVWYLKGKVHYMSGEHEEALAALSKAATIQNNSPDIWLLMGYTLVALRRYDESTQYLEYVKSLKPDSMEASAALGIVHAILGQTDASRASLDDAFSLNKAGAVVMLENFNKQFIAGSPAVEKGTKELVENLIDKARLTK